MDYRGYRVSMTSTVSVDSTTLLYGSEDGGVTVLADETARPAPKPRLGSCSAHS